LAIAAADPGSWSGRTKLEQLQPGTSVGRPQHDDLGAGVRDADDSVQKFPLQEHPRALDLETEPDEERRHRVEVGDGDADMVAPALVGWLLVHQIIHPAHS
jgi:hypothetical protein